MNRPQFVVVILCVLTIGLLLFVAATPPKKTPNGQMTVATSFYPLAYIASFVGGPYVSVQNLLPPGGEPHDYEPSPRQIALLEETDLLVFNGGHLEPWVEKWGHGGHEETHTELPHTVNIMEELEKRGAALIARNSGIDPHTWLDPILFSQEVNIIRDALIRVDPVHEGEYRANAEQLIVSLSMLDQLFREGLRDCSKQEVIVSHDAFSYLARQYGFSVVPIAGISPDEEPSPKDLAHIADIARMKGIGYIFFETTVSPKLSETIAREVGAETLVLNPLESLTNYELQSGEDYRTVMEKNLTNLRKALSCK